MPCGDVACRVHVSVAGEVAGRAQECRLALTVLPGDVPARTATLRRVRGWYLLDPAGGLVFKPGGEQSPAGPADAPVQARLLGDVPARRVFGAACRPGHARDLEVLDAYHVEPAGEIGAGLLHPVLAPVGLAGFQPGDRGQDLAAPVRPAPALGEPPLQPHEPALLAGAQARTAQHLARRQRGCHLDAAVHADNLASA